MNLSRNENSVDSEAHEIVSKMSLEFFNKIPDRILYLIAENMDPDPVSFTNCAIVSRRFFRVFTSDRVWRRLDILRVKSNIIQSYNDDYRVYGDTPEFRTECRPSCGFCGNTERPYRLDSYTERAWSQVPPEPWKQRKTPLNGHIFAWLGYLLHRPLNMPMPSNFREAITEKNTFMEHVLLMRPYCIVWLPFVRLSEDLAIRLVSKCGCVYSYLSERLRKSQRVLKAAVSTGCTIYCKEVRDNYSGKTFPLNVYHRDPREEGHI